MDKDEILRCIDNYDFICAYEKIGEKFFEIFDDYIRKLGEEGNHEKAAKIEIAFVTLINKDLAMALKGENTELAAEIAKLVSMGLSSNRDKREEMFQRLLELNKKYQGIIYLVDAILHLIEAQYDNLIEIEDFNKEITDDNLDDAIKHYENMLRAIEYDYQILKGIAKYSTKISDLAEKLLELRDKVLDFYFVLLKKKEMSNTPH